LSRVFDQSGFWEEDLVVDGVLAQYVWKGSILGLNRLQKPNIALMSSIDWKRLSSELSIARFESLGFLVELEKIAERTVDGTGASGYDVNVFRRGERAKMARTLAWMLTAARREARRRANPSEVRLKWVNTVAYLSQTYNSLLKDTELDELREQMSILQRTVKRINESRNQQP